MMHITSDKEVEDFFESIVLSQSHHGILTRQDCIIRWINPQGNRVVKQFTCEYCPLDAIFMENNLQGDNKGDDPSVAILVSPNLLRIFKNGQIFETVLNFYAYKLHKSSLGIVVEKEQTIGCELIVNHMDCMLYLLSSPDDTLRPIVTVDHSGTRSDELTRRNLSDDALVLSVWKNLVAYYDSSTGMVSLHRLQEASPGESAALETSSTSDVDLTSSYVKFNQTDTFGLDDTAYGGVMGAAGLEESTNSGGSPDYGRRRYTAKKKTHRIATGSKRPGTKHPRNNLASALGVSGISGDERSVSPYRGMDSMRRATSGSPGAHSSLSAASMSRLLDEPFDPSQENSLGLKASLEAAAEGDSVFILRSIGWLRVSSDDGHVEMPDVSFSQSRSDVTLVHILCKNSKMLSTYSFTTRLLFDKESPVDCLEVSGNDMSVSGEVPSPTSSTSPTLQLVRRTEGVRSVTHLSMGGVPFSSNLEKENPLIGTIVVSDEDGKCRMSFGSGLNVLDVNPLAQTGRDLQILSVAAVASTDGNQNSAQEGCHLLVTYEESGLEGSKGRRLVSTFPEFSCIRRRVSASLLNHRHRMFSSLFEVLLGVAVVERENESPQTSLQTGAISLLRFLSCLEDQVSFGSRDAIVTTLLMLALSMQRAFMLSVSPMEKADTFWQLYEKILTAAFSGDKKVSTLFFIDRDIIVSLFTDLDECVKQGEGHDDSIQLIESLLRLIYETSHMILEDIQVRGLDTHELSEYASCIVTMFSLVPYEDQRVGSFRVYYSRLISAMDINISTINSLMERELEILVKKSSSVGETGQVPSSFQSIVSNLSWLALPSASEFLDRLLISPFEEMISAVTALCAIGEPLHDSMLPLQLHISLLPHTTLSSYLFTDLHICRKLDNSKENKSSVVTSAENDIIISAAFLSTCEFGRNYMNMSGEEVLDAFCYSLRLAIAQSLLSVRYDLSGVVERCKACRRERARHSESCVLNRWNRPMCNCRSNSRGTSNADGPTETGTVTPRCYCRELKALDHPQRLPFLPADVLTMLGREDFSMNYMRSAVDGGEASGDDWRHLLQRKSSAYDSLDNIVRAFPHLARSNDGAFASEENEIGENRRDQGGGALSAAAGANTDRVNSFSSAGDDLDGLIRIEKMSVSRFAEDERMHEACRQLGSSRLLYLKVERTPEMNDSKYRYEQQRRLLSLCRRSLACSVGRGMLSLSSLDPLLAERLPIPPLVLSGRVPPTNATITLDTSTASADLMLWPNFHNGVAAGLRVRSGGSNGKSGITRNWILYNRSSSLWTDGSASAVMTPIMAENAHAGSLLAFGLLGHLKVLTTADVVEYLTKGHEPTTIATLIGLAASHIGTAHPLMSKTLCLHLPSLVYPSQPNGEVEVSSLVQTSALVGLGLLHCGKASRLMVEFFMTELASKNSLLATSSTPTATSPSDARETAALAAGWGLGMLLLGRGRSHSDVLAGEHGHISDLRVEDRLQQCIDGGRKRQHSTIFGGDHGSEYSSKSCRILEGDFINTNVTSPGAVMGLALMYIRSNNEEIAGHIAVPSTTFALDNIRPDLLLFRAMGTCLIMWDQVDASVEWIQSKVPKILVNFLLGNAAAPMPTSPSHHDNPAEEAIRTQTLSDNVFDPSASTMSARSSFLALLCVMSGYCWGLALRFAGTSEPEAKRIILAQLRFLHCLRDGAIPPPESVLFMDSSERENLSIKTHSTQMKKLLQFSTERACKPTVEMCVTLLAVSSGMVCAGSGDLDVMRVLRVLRRKLDDVPYGSHMGIGMGMGMLFLGQGKSSFKRDDVSVGALVLSTSPRFPARTMDNISHLQALRHLYVIAIEERCLHAIDIDTGLSTPLDVEVHLKSNQSLQLRIPTLLPELSSIKSITSLGDDYFPASLDFHSNVMGFGGNDDSRKVVDSCCCDTDLAESKIPVTRSRSSRLDSAASTHSTSRATILSIKRKHPILEGFASNLLRNGSLSKISGADLTTLWNSPPGGAVYTKAMAKYLSDTMSLIRAQPCGSQSSPIVAAITEAYCSSVSAALSSPCMLLRKFTAELLALHSNLNVSFEQWTCNSAVEACILRGLIRVFPHLGCICSKTSDITLDSTSLASCARSVICSVHKLCGKTSVSEVLKLLYENHQKSMKSSRFDNKSSSLIALILGIPASEVKLNSKLSTLSSDPTFSSEEKCSIEQLESMMNQIIVAMSSA